MPQAKLISSSHSSAGAGDADTEPGMLWRERRGTGPASAGHTGSGPRVSWTWGNGAAESMGEGATSTVFKVRDGKENKKEKKHMPG